jgi:hypothetical protein
MKLGTNQINFKKPACYGCQIAEEVKGISKDAFDENKMTEIFTFLFKSREAKTLVTIAKAIQSSENQTAHHLKTLLEMGRVFYIPTGGGRWGLSKSIK